jgi:Uma2 family endonuclease
MSSNPKYLYSPDEYLEIERKAEFKSEFYFGEIFAMSGASRNHNLLVSNIVTTLNSQLAQHECEVYPSDMRVKTPERGVYTYPDVVVVCGSPVFEDTHVDTLTNPTLIVEVLSPSTESYDRGKKFEQYRRMPSLIEYVLISQDEYRVVVFSRQSDSQWLFKEGSSLEEKLILSSINCVLELEDVYRKVGVTG